MVLPNINCQSKVDKMSDSSVVELAVVSQRDS